MKIHHPLLQSLPAILLACFLTSCVRHRIRDHREDRRDYIENRIDESYNRGPLDRLEDRHDRREDRWDRRGF
jgi:hypothetical protein